MKRFWPMFRKEFIQMRRDRLTLGIMVGIPVVQLLMFGYAIQMDVRDIPTVVLDQSRTPESREIVAAFQNTGNFRIVAHVDGRRALDAAIARGAAQDRKSTRLNSSHRTISYAVFCLKKKKKKKTRNRKKKKK